MARSIGCLISCTMIIVIMAMAVAHVESSQSMQNDGVDQSPAQTLATNEFSVSGMSRSVMRISASNTDKKNCRVMNPCELARRTARSFARSVSSLVIAQNMSEQAGYSYMDSIIGRYKAFQSMDKRCFKATFNKLYYRYYNIYKKDRLEDVCKESGISKVSIQRLHKAKWTVNGRIRMINEEMTDSDFPPTPNDLAELKQEKSELIKIAKIINEKIRNHKLPRDSRRDIQNDEHIVGHKKSVTHRKKVQTISHTHRVRDTPEANQRNTKGQPRISQQKNKRPRQNTDKTNSPNSPTQTTPANKQPTRSARTTHNQRKTANNHNPKSSKTTPAKDIHQSPSRQPATGHPNAHQLSNRKSARHPPTDKPATATSRRAHTGTPRLDGHRDPRDKLTRDGRVHGQPSRENRGFRTKRGKLPNSDDNKDGRPGHGDRGKHQRSPRSSQKGDKRRDHNEPKNIANGNPRGKIEQNGRGKGQRQLIGSSNPERKLGNRRNRLDNDNPKSRTARSNPQKNNKNAQSLNKPRNQNQNGQKQKPMPRNANRNRPEQKEHQRIAENHRREAKMQVKVEKTVHKLVEKIDHQTEKRRKNDEQLRKKQIKKLIKDRESKYRNNFIKPVKQRSIRQKIDTKTNTKQPPIQQGDRKKRIKNFQIQYPHKAFGTRRGNLANPNTPDFKQGQDQQQRSWQFEVEKYKRREATRRWTLERRLARVKILLHELEVQRRQMQTEPAMARVIVILQQYEDFNRNKQKLLLAQIGRVEPLDNKIKQLRYSLAQARSMPDQRRVIYDLQEEIEVQLEQKEDSNYELEKKLYFRELTLIRTLQEILTKDMDTISRDKTIKEQRKLHMIHLMHQRSTRLGRRDIVLLRRLKGFANRVNARRLVRYHRRILDSRILYYMEQHDVEAVKRLQAHLNSLNDELISKWRERALKEQAAEKIQGLEARVISLILNQYDFHNQPEKAPKSQGISPAGNQDQDIEDAYIEYENQIENIENDIESIVNKHDKIITEMLEGLSRSDASCSTAKFVELENQKDQIAEYRKTLVAQIDRMSFSAERNGTQELENSVEQLRQQSEAITEYILICSKRTSRPLVVSDGHIDDSTNMMKKPKIDKHMAVKPNLTNDKANMFWDKLGNAWIVIENDGSPIDRQVGAEEEFKMKNCNQQMIASSVARLHTLESERLAILKSWSDLAANDQHVLDQGFRSILFRINTLMSRLNSLIRTCGYEQKPSSNNNVVKGQVGEPVLDTNIEEIELEDDRKARGAYHDRLKVFIIKLREQRMYRIDQDRNIGKLVRDLDTIRRLRDHQIRLEAERDFILVVWPQVIPRHQLIYQGDMKLAVSAIALNIEYLREMMVRYQPEANPNNGDGQSPTNPSPQTSHIPEQAHPQMETPSLKNLHGLIQTVLAYNDKEIEDLVLSAPQGLTQQTLLRLTQEISQLNMKKTELQSAYELVAQDQPADIQVPQMTIRYFNLAVNLVDEQTTKLSMIEQQYRHNVLNRQKSSQRKALHRGPQNYLQRSADTRQIQAVQHQRIESLTRAIEHARIELPAEVDMLIHYGKTSETDAKLRGQERECLESTLAEARQLQKQIEIENEVLNVDWNSLLEDDKKILDTHHAEAVNNIQEQKKILEAYVSKCKVSEQIIQTADPQEQHLTAIRVERQPGQNANDQQHPGNHQQAGKLNTQQAQKEYQVILEEFRKQLKAIGERVTPDIYRIVILGQTEKNCVTSNLDIVSKEITYLNQEKSQLEKYYYSLIETDRRNIDFEYRYVDSIIDSKLTNLNSYLENCKLIYHSKTLSHGNLLNPNTLSTIQAHGNTSSTTHPHTDINHLILQQPANNKIDHKPRTKKLRLHLIRKKTWPFDKKQPTAAVNCQYPPIVEVEYESIVQNTRPTEEQTLRELQSLIRENLKLTIEMAELKRKGNTDELKKRHGQYAQIVHRIAALKEELRYYGHKQARSTICRIRPVISQPRNREELQKIYEAVYNPGMKPDLHSINEATIITTGDRSVVNGQTQIIYTETIIEQPQPAQQSTTTVTTITNSISPNAPPIATVGTIMDRLKKSALLPITPIGVQSQPTPASTITHFEGQPTPSSTITHFEGQPTPSSTITHFEGQPSPASTTTESPARQQQHRIPATNDVRPHEQVVNRLQSTVGRLALVSSQILNAN